ncbi:efflux RND transporter periplasmic adaptor subunit [Pseudoalteromonas sp. McH1-7]|uniref:efflux RND transporter periplasmic adaptor subunit n=1 Tax=unclassified Pseudoalteromonas TaxID=194690 RepID=UPI0015903ED6|nr:MULTISPECIES: efflux RND transporter periplasmic adaptor subunit [unclassified Pseudoalteromonas]NUZ09979.1 efflux RND transporter periplasmic adaptor subunit [Pseudoalteromonas sp. McH1-7]USD30950.1 efflux RND transporter periplasmic adaptor subunit [Pseudoalteromonas sp. SCSIO 43201]
MQILKNCTFCLMFTAMFSSSVYSGESHDDDHAVHENDNQIVLTQQQLDFAGVKIETLQLQHHERLYFAPGEVKANGYTSYLVAPRVDSIVLERHTTLGSMVEVNEPLITLFSEAMAQAQSQYLIASTQWDRVKRLSSTAISERARVQANADFSAAYSRLIALGVEGTAIDAIKHKPASEFGHYTLVAQRAGIVTQDSFTQGQHVAAGKTLMAISDENELWVDAQIQPSSQLKLTSDIKAWVNVEGKDHEAQVIQEAHTLDPITRTRRVRLLVKNSEHKLHAGMFVNVYFRIPSTAQAIAVPDDALSRSTDGDWVVYVEASPGTFYPKEVQLGERFGEQVEIIGLSPGQRIAINGAFFIASEQAKAGFDPHNH